MVAASALDRKLCTCGHGLASSARDCRCPPDLVAGPDQHVLHPARSGGGADGSRSKGRLPRRPGFRAQYRVLVQQKTTLAEEQNRPVGAAGRPWRAESDAVADGGVGREVSGHYRVDCEGQQCGTLPPFAGAAIAGAENLCGCGTLIIAMQHRWPKRSLKLATKRRIQTPLFLLSARPELERWMRLLLTVCQYRSRKFSFSFP